MCHGECQGSRSGAAHPFSAEGCEGSEESEEVWIYNHKSTLRRELEEKEALPELYRTIGESYRNLDDWSMFLITSYTDAEKYIGRKADRNRKIYNGMIKSYFYQFMGPKPPKRRREEA